MVEIQNYELNGQLMLLNRIYKSCFQKVVSQQSYLREKENVEKHWLV